MATTYKRTDDTREPRGRLAIGTTYAHWPIDGYEGRYYLTRCPRCNHPARRTKQELERQSGCSKCRRR